MLSTGARVIFELDELELQAQEEVGVLAQVQGHLLRRPDS